MLEKILVPLDGSKFAKQVFPHVVELAQAYDSEVVLIGICEPEESKYQEVFQRYIESEAEELRKRIEKRAKVSVKSEVLVGECADEIPDYADKNNISLIVMASHGRSGVIPGSLGSTVTKVLHQVNIPLIIVRAREEPLESEREGLFSKILVPLDGTEASARVLPFVIEITKKLPSEVTLLQVVASGKHVHTIGGLDFVRFTDLNINRMEENAQRYLDAAGAKFAGTKAKVKTEVRLGDAAREVIGYVHQSDFSLIAMASHGYSRIERWFHESISFKILQASEKPVLIVSSLGAPK